MSFRLASNTAAIEVNNLSKCYELYKQPIDRLKQFIWRGKRQYYRELWALHAVNFTVQPGEVVGIVGRNGSGKSTLLQLVCGTLTPTSGQVQVNGRIAALLELGAGFNPEFTGRENVLMSAAIMGLTQSEIATRIDAIIEFSGISNFIDQPVKTYSSGMYVRLAFSVAINVDPDILVIDEALSVGDGEFARKSFDQIMALKDAGKTILFCSHSLYQIEAICSQAIWLDQGRMMLFDTPARVATEYNTELMRLATTKEHSQRANDKKTATASTTASATPSAARIDKVKVSANGESGQLLAVRSKETDVVIRVDFSSDHSLPIPTIAIGIHTKSGHAVTSAGSFYDKVILHRESDGRGFGEVIYPSIPLLKGDYTISVFLTCERMVHVYDYAERCAELVVEQCGLEQGVVVLPHVWRDALTIQE